MDSGSHEMDHREGRQGEPPSRPFRVILHTRDESWERQLDDEADLLPWAVAETPLGRLMPASSHQDLQVALAEVLRTGGVRTVCWPAQTRTTGDLVSGDCQLCATLLHPRVEPEQSPLLILGLAEERMTGNASVQSLQDQLTHTHRQLLQSAKMAAVGQLAAGVAHEINNPIGYVFSNLGTLADYVRDLISLTDAIDECDDLGKLRQKKLLLDYQFIRNDVSSLIAESEHGIHRIKQTISSLKDFTHQDEEKFEISQPNTEILSALRIAGSELKYKADIVLELGDIPEIPCIRSQIGQVILNLLINAAHSIPSYGKICIRTGLLAEQVWIEVEDNGCGIPLEIQDRIFEPFFSTKEVGKGTGLGLAISYNIVQRHGGRIDIDSTLGCGSRFRIWLPAGQPPEHASGTARQTSTHAT